LNLKYFSAIQLIEEIKFFDNLNVTTLDKNKNSQNFVPKHNSWYFCYNYYLKCYYPKEWNNFFSQFILHIKNEPQYDYFIYNNDICFLNKNLENCLDLFLYSDNCNNVALPMMNSYNSDISKLDSKQNEIKETNKPEESLQKIKENQTIQTKQDEKMQIDKNLSEKLPQNEEPEGLISELDPNLKKINDGQINEADEKKIESNIQSESQIQKSNQPKEELPKKEAEEFNDQSNINIILLGESGVGKSTFINAYLNYLNYNSLDEAEKSSEVLSIIGSQFNFLDKDLKSILVKIGNSDNECFITGQSSTQQAKSHKFKLNGKTIQIIDTPGKKNFNFKKIFFFKLF
jgi:hypothetical protein